jgi:hypothetical protein
LAQFRAFHEVRVQRDEASAERDQARRATIPPEPHWMSLDDYQRRVKELEGEWQIQLPTPEGAQRWLREGWERDEIDGHPVEVGGPLAKSRALAGSSEAAGLRAARRYQSRLDRHSSKRLQAQPVSIYLGWQPAQEEKQEEGIYLLTQRGREEAERLSSGR